MPFIHHLLDPTRGVTQQEVTGSEGQLVRAVAGELVLVIDILQHLLGIAVTWINIVHGAGSAESLAPRPGCGIRDDSREDSDALHEALKRLVAMYN